MQLGNYKEEFIMKKNRNRTRQSLGYKLQLLADGEEQGLTAAEAAVYGVEYADELPDEEDRREVEDGE